jgi:hypothetical protein
VSAYEVLHSVSFNTDPLGPPPFAARHVIGRKAVVSRVWPGARWSAQVYGTLIALLP